MIEVLQLNVTLKIMMDILQLNWMTSLFLLSKLDDKVQKSKHMKLLSK